MQKKNWLRLGLIAAFLIAGFLALQLSSAPPVEKKTCCKKTTPECVEKSPTPLDVLPESLSRQFIMLLSPSF